MGEKKVYSVAIDGPAGAGKSTLAKQVAQNLGFVYVDTGAIYRAVGYHMDLMGIGPKDKDGIERLLDDVNLKLTYDAGGLQHVILNGMDVKIYLTASPEVRARRRQKELEEKGFSCAYETVLNEIRERDAQDMSRTVAPLQQAADAEVLDTSDLNREQALAALESTIRRRLGL